MQIIDTLKIFLIGYENINDHNQNFIAHAFIFILLGKILVIKKIPKKRYKKTPIHDPLKQITVLDDNVNYLLQMQRNMKTLKEKFTLLEGLFVAREKAFQNYTIKQNLVIVENNNNAVSLQIIKNFPTQLYLNTVKKLAMEEANNEFLNKCYSKK